MSRITSRSSAAVKRAPARAAAPAPAAAGWTFFSNHSHVLFCLAADEDLLLRDVAARVGITERAVQRIVSELEAAGVLVREREGRRNRYRVDRRARLRHPVEAHCTVGELLALVNG
jgi:DNA-binding transcriptional ArsR family regulator